MNISVKEPRCSKCRKTLTFSMTGEYIRCIDLRCKYIILNECIRCKKSSYTKKIDTELKMSYFECKECKHIIC